MNAMIDPRAIDRSTAREHAVLSAKQWLASMIDLFTRAEASVTETILILSQVPQIGGSVKRRHLIGQRLCDLADVIGPEGPFARQGAAARRHLEEFRQFELLRHQLCHGLMRVTLAPDRSWVVNLTLFTFRAKEPDRTAYVIVQAEGEALLADLRSREQKLSSALGSLRRAATTPAQQTVQSTDDSAP